MKMGSKTLFVILIQLLSSKLIDCKSLVLSKPRFISTSVGVVSLRDTEFQTYNTGSRISYIKNQSRNRKLCSMKPTVPVLRNSFYNGANIEERGFVNKNNALFERHAINIDQNIENIMGLEKKLTLPIEKVISSFEIFPSILGESNNPLFDMAKNQNSLEPLFILNSFSTGDAIRVPSTTHQVEANAYIEESSISLIDRKNEPLTVAYLQHELGLTEYTLMNIILNYSWIMYLKVNSNLR